MPPDCKLIGGGASAWRKALELHGEGLAKALDTIHSRTKVKVYVVPTTVEGSYAYTSAEISLKKHIADDKEKPATKLTEFVWDIGGGSMQLGTSDKSNGWGEALGQREWRKLFCNSIKKKPGECTCDRTEETLPECPVNPVGEDASGNFVNPEAKAKEILAAYLHDASGKLKASGGFEVTAVSAPVVKMMHPMLRYLAENGKIEGSVDANGFSDSVLVKGIEKLKTLNTEEITGSIKGLSMKGDSCKEINSKYIDTAVTDMLLVRAFMEKLGLEWVGVMGLDINNGQGIVKDGSALAWTKDDMRYSCYLQLLYKEGAKGKEGVEKIVYDANPDDACREKGLLTESMR